MHCRPTGRLYQIRVSGLGRFNGNFTQSKLILSTFNYLHQDTLKLATIGKSVHLFALVARIRQMLPIGLFWQKLHYRYLSWNSQSGSVTDLDLAIDLPLVNFHFALLFGTIWPELISMTMDNHIENSIVVAMQKIDA